jgi:hypothetical protein
VIICPFHVIRYKSVILQFSSTNRLLLLLLLLRLAA